MKVDANIRALRDGEIERKKYKKERKIKRNRKRKEKKIKTNVFTKINK